jgi:hypothetical protein
VCVLAVSALADALSAKILAGIAALLALLWHGRAKGRFRGPEVSLAQFEARARD